MVVVAHALDHGPVKTKGNDQGIIAREDRAAFGHDDDGRDRGK